MTFARTLVLSTFLLVPASAPAQDAPTKPLPPDVPSQGLVDVGLRTGTTDGDDARFERYRDLRNGGASLFTFGKRTDAYVFDASASNVGYRDQRYQASYTNGRLTLSGLFDAIPLNYIYGAPAPWVGDGNGTFTLDTATRLAVQNRELVGVPCAPGGPPAACNATTAAQAQANRSIYNQLAVPTDLQARRDTLAVRAAYEISTAVSFDADFSTTKRSGEMPWAAPFAFNNVNELPVPLDQRTNELKAGTEWAHARGMVRLDYWGSYFGNNIQTLRWDNPIRATDTTPFNASAYSNGQGPALGQMALWPGNSLNSVGTTAVYRLARRTTINGNLQFTNMRQNETLLPFTSNPQLQTPAVLAQYPGLAGLPRSTTDAQVNAYNALVTVNSRPVNNLALMARYRYNKHDNNTPSFDGRTYARLDGSPGTIADNPLTPHIEGESEYFQIDRQNLDLTGTVTLRGYGAVRLGYSNEQFDREGRGFSQTSENVFRLSYDAMALGPLTVRAALDHGRRRGEGFILQGLDYEEGVAGSQPGLRYYDEANRNRTRGSVMVSAQPTDIISLNLQVATTRDEYLADDFIPQGRDFFGLQRADITAFTAGIDVQPGDRYGFGASYGRERFETLQKSRNANPPPDASWTDPNRDWTLDNGETVNTVMAYLDLYQVINDRGEVRLGYEYNDSDIAFLYGGPRIPALQALGQFTPLPNVTNDWQRFTADFRYFVTAQVGFGLGYWYEKLGITDWRTIDSNGPVGFAAATGTPRIDWLGGLMTGYANRPYTGNRLFARLLYRF